ncbi:MAG TPA: 50S ribosomal protein L17 [Chitinophagales bacterium]|nr:50S ribosomal protein L17 [Chitinophagales bacterium]HNL17542.1 50S ribosomal protein L17 [Chitinophagales bacterium]
MRHGNKINHLGRTYGHRSALLKNLSNALIMHKRIETTLAKAKELRVYVEPLISKSKENTTHSRRTAFSKLQNKYAAKELFDIIGPKVGERPGGYTRIIKLGKRLGDNAEMALIELVDFNEIYSANKSAQTTTDTKKRTRRATSKKKQTEETQDAVESTETPTENAEA